VQGDFSRDTFDRLQHFSRVLRQQGRVDVDADTNEQTSILLHLIRSLARDVYGDSWGRGFEITPQQNTGTVTELLVGTGRFYVDGVMCENEPRLACGTALSESTAYSAQLPKPEALTMDGLFLVYLEVWEQHVNWIEEPGIREVALGGPDTASRSRVVWRVRVAAGDGFGNLKSHDDVIKTPNEWTTFVQEIRSGNRGCLIASLKKSPGSDEPCPTAPGSRYRGTENQLYRIQIHRGGTRDADPKKTATFIWSRDNGCLVYGIRKLMPDTGKNLARVSLDSLGRDAGQRLEAKNWVELVAGGAGHPRLYRIAKIFPEDLALDLDVPSNDVSEITDASTRAYLRRWDHPGDPNYDGAIPIPDDKKPVSIENGIEITFTDPTAKYQADDYWLIPARTATGDIEWPPKEDNPDEPLPQSPRGEEHHFAALAVIDPTQSVAANRIKDLRRKMT
jgi:hypothetical protein